MVKVSFDFDGTLNRDKIFNYAMFLKDKNIEIFIVTSRKKNPHFYNNDDIYEYAERLNIKEENIIFTNTDDKYKYLPKDILWHIDDDDVELRNIANKTNIFPVSSNYNNFIVVCETIIKNYNIINEKI